MRKLQRLQKRLDARWGFDFPLWNDVTSPQGKLPSIFRDMRDPSTDARLRQLEFATLALAGEVGELANAVKKVRRRLLLGADADEIRWASVQEEVADIFAYLLKLANLMDWDLEALYRQKMKENEERFENIRDGVHHTRER